MKLSFALLIAISIIFIGCEKAIEGHKILDINFSNAKTGESIDSIFCYINQPLFTSAQMITGSFSNTNGNCHMEVDYKASDRYTFLIRDAIAFNGNKVFTYRGLFPNDKYYRVKGIRQYISLGEKNKFDLKYDLIPLFKLVTIFEFGKTYNGLVSFEMIENNESIYSTFRGGYKLNSEWTITNKDSVNCYLSSIDKTKLVYSIISNDGKTTFSKSVTIDPANIVNKTINLKFE